MCSFFVSISSAAVRKTGKRCEMHQKLPIYPVKWQKMALGGVFLRFLCIMDRRRKNGSKIVHNDGDYLFVFCFPTVRYSSGLRCPCGKVGKKHLHHVFAFIIQASAIRKINEK